MKTKNIFTYSLFLLFSSCNNSINKVEGSNPIVQIIEPTQTSSGTIDGNIFGCGYDHSLNKNTIELYYARPKELDQINSIVKFTGISPNFKIFGASINNAVATIINNERYILYDPELLSYTDYKSNSYWASMSILAHEIGHHLSGHTLNHVGSNYKDELEADKYSGFILFKLGASLSEATNAINMLGSNTASQTHPSKKDRIDAITQGWYEASQQINSSAIPPRNEMYDQLVGLEFYIEDFYEQEYLEYCKNREVGNFIGYIISKTNKTNEPKTILVELTEIRNVKNILIPEMFKTGKRVEILLNEPYYAPNATRGYFEDILIPGSKILFKVCQEGNAGYPYLSYVQLLRRTD